MSRKAATIVLAVFFIAALRLGAQTISVQIIEEGRPGAVPDGFSEALISGAMNEAFDRGLIATSGKPAVDFNRKFREWPLSRSEELKQAMVTHVIMILYKKDTFGRPGVSYPGRFEFYLWDIEKGEASHRGEIPGMPTSEIMEGGREAVLAYCAETGRSLARECLEALR